MFEAFIRHSLPPSLLAFSYTTPSFPLTPTPLSGISVLDDLTSDGEAQRLTQSATQLLADIKDDVWLEPQGGRLKGGTHRSFRTITWTRSRDAAVTTDGDGTSRPVPLAQWAQRLQGHPSTCLLYTSPSPRDS